MTLTQLLCVPVPKRVGSVFFSICMEKLPINIQGGYPMRSLYVYMKILNNETY